MTTVLQQGDTIGTTGETGADGATGETGAQGAFTNVLSVNLVYTFSPDLTPSAVSLAKTYVVEAGTSGFWKASGVHSYVNGNFQALPAITTISNFLETSTDDFNVRLQIKKIKILDSDNTIILLPINSPMTITAEIHETSDDNIVIRFIQSQGQPMSFQHIALLAGVRELSFSLLIIGTDQ